MSELDESPLRRGDGPATVTASSNQVNPRLISFDRRELNEIFKIYGRMVADGEWRDYAIDMLNEKAVFSIFRRASEMPIYRVEKKPRAARRQGAYSVVAAGGLIIKRGHDLTRVLRVLDKRRHLRLVGA
jgi:hypothetical protein